MGASKQNPVDPWQVASEDGHLTDPQTWDLLFSMSRWNLNTACAMLVGEHPVKKLPGAMALGMPPKTANGKYLLQRARADGAPEKSPPLLLLRWARDTGVMMPPGLQDAWTRREAAIAGAERPAGPDSEEGQAGSQPSQLMVEEYSLDEVDVAILKVLNKVGHSLPYIDIGESLPPGSRRGYKAVRKRCKRLATGAHPLLTTPPRKGAQITAAGVAAIPDL